MNERLRTAAIEIGERAKRPTTKEADDILTVARTGFLIEPVFYFPDSWGDLHRRAVEPSWRWST